MKSSVIVISVLFLVAIVSCSKPKSSSSESEQTSESTKAPYGVAVPGKTGFVQSPYAPKAGYVDVRGFKKGTEVKDPYSGKMFLVPEPVAATPTPVSSGPATQFETVVH